MKRALLLGDSIRISYQPLVKEALADRVDVVGSVENGRFIKYTLWQVQDWLQDCGSPDIVHWNNGIWDLFHHNEDMGVFTSADEYLRDLARNLCQLKKSGAAIIWASTTPVDHRFKFCFNHEIDQYNLLAADFMTSQGITINDLNAVVKNDPARYISNDFLHLSPEGQQACAQAVANVIARFL